MALSAARDMVCEAIHRGHLNLDHYVVVSDPAGAGLLSVTYREAFTVKG